MLTFEFEDNNALYVHGNRDGLLRLADMLTRLANSKLPDHVHLMSPEWGALAFPMNLWGPIPPCSSM